MTKKDILIEVEGGQTRLCALENGELAEYYVERQGQEKLAGNIYRGRVANILPGMQAAFVDIGLEKNAFLHVGDIAIDKRDFGEAAEAVERQLADSPIRKLLKVGQELTVQVVKEPGGTKGPRISSHLTLPGRMVVLLPTVNYVGISRRIEDEAERGRLRAAADSARPAGMGLIVRTAAENASEEDLQSDIESLIRLWQSIVDRAEYAPAPTLIHSDGSLVYRSVRDMLTEDVEKVLIDDDAQVAFARATAAMLSPHLADRIGRYDGDGLLFDAYRVDTMLKKALSRKVWLKSGGYLIVEHTEALTVIDVNTGKFVGSKSLGETVFQINCEAVGEIVRQLRLRDIGGIVVIDFIDMQTEEQKQSLLAQLRQELKRDRNRTNVLGLTGLGLVEMTRKKVHQPLHTFLKQNCPVCGGSGMVDSDETATRAILHELRRMETSAQSSSYLVKTSTGVAGQLMLIGTSIAARVFVLVDGEKRVSSYEIEPMLGNPPPKAREIPRANGERERST